MYTENQIEKLIQPILKNQERISIEVIRRFGSKIKEVKEVDTTVSTSLLKVRNSKQEADKLQEDIERELQRAIEEIYFLLLVVAADTYSDSEYLYKYRDIQFLPFNRNTGIQRATTTVGNQVKDLFQQLFSFPGFIIRDLQSPQILKPTSISDTYQTLTDEAVQAVQNTSMDFDASMQRTEQQIVDSGLRGIYIDENGKVFSQRLDSAVRNNLLDGISMIQQAVQDEVGIQVDADGKELSAHMFSAPDHEPFQGHQFTNENWDLLQSSMDFEDVNGQAFMGVERIIGVWNCRHFAWSIIIGESKPMYSQMELNQFIENNHIGYTLSNGTHLTMYECTQRQRNYESRIRQAKEGLFFAEQMNNDRLQKKYRAMIARRTNNYEAFSAECGLPVHKERTEIVTK